MIKYFLVLFILILFSVVIISLSMSSPVLKKGRGFYDSDLIINSNGNIYISAAEITSPYLMSFNDGTPYEVSSLTYSSTQGAGKYRIFHKGDRIKLQSFSNTGYNNIINMSGGSNYMFSGTDFTQFLTFHQLFTSLKLTCSHPFVNATNTSFMFTGCIGIKSLSDLNLPSSVTFEKVTTTSFMFGNCTSLETLSGFPSSVTFENVTIASNMFLNCTSLTNVIFTSSVIFGDVINASNMFMNVPATTITISESAFNKLVSKGAGIGSWTRIDP